LCGVLDALSSLHGYYYDARLLMGGKKVSDLNGAGAVRCSAVQGRQGAAIFTQKEMHSKNDIRL
jgi:hypothetical protein